MIYHMTEGGEVLKNFFAFFDWDVVGFFDDTLVGGADYATACCDFFDSVSAPTDDSRHCENRRV